MKRVLQLMAIANTKILIFVLFLILYLATRQFVVRYLKLEMVK